MTSETHEPPARESNEASFAQLDVAIEQGQAYGKALHAKEEE